jgi:hypothetical protein
MNARRWIVGFVALAVTGCGDDGGEARTHTPEDLNAALLTAEDLDDGWTEAMREVVTTATTPAPDPDVGILCPESAELVKSLGVLDNSEMAMS